MIWDFKNISYSVCTINCAQMYNNSAFSYPFDRSKPSLINNFLNDKIFMHLIMIVQEAHMIGLSRHTRMKLFMSSAFPFKEM